jgi:NADH-quinone oxidoreductase subunit A
MGDELNSFVPILIYLVLVIGFAVGSLMAAHLLSPFKRTEVKDMPYESGMDPTGDARQHFDVKFYLVAILFLVFDVELLFLYPWAVSAYQPVDAQHNTVGIPEGLRDPVFAIMLIFLATLAIAYIYAWRKGVFRWR